MGKNLFIVESPAKAKTIEGFLGKDFIVKSSIGHIRDLVKKGMGIDIKNDFEPTYEISPDKTKVVAELKKLAKDADMVWLASDEDREGEAIAWHLSEALNLKKSNTKRIVYHEITKGAIINALENPRDIDQNLVNAQQARRVLDRLVGFELSPILWKKIRPSLSAGRVQSVSVRLIVEREREIVAFKSTSLYKVVGVFKNADGSVIKADLAKRLASKEEATEFLEKCKSATFTISNVETKPAKKSPSAPFTTSTLQQEAGRKFGYSVAQTMRVAQGLYESGKITYMRTDSVNLSQTALDAAAAEVTRIYGENFVNTRQYKSKSKNAQEAHEAIRPTYFNQHSIDGDVQALRLYDLIWKRTIASQMADAQIEKTTATIKVSTSDLNFVAQGEVLKFEGFLKVYLETKEEDVEDEAAEGILPPLKTGEKLTLQEASGTERFTHHPARYTEASLVKKLEELGIGRPSTYAPTISTIQKRGYIVKEDRSGTPRNYNLIQLKDGSVNTEVRSENTGVEKSKLFPTDIGMVVNDFLTEHFPQIMDYGFTAKVEEEFDEVAEGKLEWTKMLKDFYKPFHKTVEVTTETSERASGERILGNDPKTGKPIIARIGRFGPMVQLGEQSETEKPKYAGMRKDQRLDTITLEEALDLFKLPRAIGQYENEEITVAIGRFGPYLKHNSLFYSLPKTDDPYTIEFDRAVEILKMPKLPRELGMYKGIMVSAAKGRFGPYIKYDDLFCSMPKNEDPFEITLEKAIQLIDEKQKKESEKIIKKFEGNTSVKVVNGRYGPCIQAGRKFFKIPKDKQPEELTLEECLDIAGLNEKKKEPKAAKTAKKAPAKKVSAKKAPAKKAVKAKKK
jgi:DNA topoisomerase-1